jgi:hypothetical protein
MFLIFTGMMSSDSDHMNVYAMQQDPGVYRPVIVAYRGGFGGSTHPPKLRSFAKTEPNSQFRGIYICNNVITTWVSFIYKLSGTPD